MVKFQMLDLNFRIEIGFIDELLERFYQTKFCLFFNPNKFIKNYLDENLRELTSYIKLVKYESRGQWVKYNQDNKEDAKRLFQSLQNKQTDWCTANNYLTAKQQIQSGDFYVYYTHNTQGDSTQPRIAIRMIDHNKIGEIRGIAPYQEIELNMVWELMKKLKEFDSKDKFYHLATNDRLRLAILRKRQQQRKKISLLDLNFLFSDIQGFGHIKDPCIEELQRAFYKK